jgi:hypothetical protein
LIFFFDFSHQLNELAEQTWWRLRRKIVFPRFFVFFSKKREKIAHISSNRPNSQNGGTTCGDAVGRGVVVSSAGEFFGLSSIGDVVIAEIDDDVMDQLLVASVNKWFHLSEQKTPLIHPSLNPTQLEAPSFSITRKHSLR